MQTYSFHYHTVQADSLWWHLADTTSPSATATGLPTAFQTVHRQRNSHTCGQRIKHAFRSLLEIQLLIHTGGRSWSCAKLPWSQIRGLTMTPWMTYVCTCGAVYAFGKDSWSSRPNFFVWYASKILITRIQRCLS